MAIWDRKEISEQSKSAYIKALKPYTDDEIRQAGYKCIDNCSYFPKPAQILGYIYTDQASKQYGAKFNMYSRYCQVCKKTDCITMKDDGDDRTGEKGDDLWKCRECYSGISSDEYQQRMYNIIEMIEEKTLNLNERN